MSGPQDVWGATISAWAQAQDDIEALVQIGSRVQEGATVDSWSDYDYQVITSRPERYRDGSFAKELGPCWASGAQVSFGNAVKVTAVFDGALEVDFVVLRHVEVVIATLALRWPSATWWWPSSLRRGVRDLRIVAAPGWRVIKGGALWEGRYARIAPFQDSLSEPGFNALCDVFWVQLVWAAKKAARGESLASQRAIHESLVEGCLRIFQEEAILEGRRAYPLGRRAESWLTEPQLRALSVGTQPNRAALMEAMARLSGEFAAASSRVAEQRHWRYREHAEVINWLGKVPGPPSS
jgi:hypothetical protein